MTLNFGEPLIHIVCGESLESVCKLPTVQSLSFRENKN
jgi:hypothetical protein